VVKIVIEEMGVKIHHDRRIEIIILEFIRKKAILASTNDSQFNNYLFRHNISNAIFPATTLDIAKVVVDLPVSTIYDLLEKLKRSKKIKSRLFQWFNKKIRLYIPYEMTWPGYLFYLCKECENWNRFTRECTFLQELYSLGFLLDFERVKKKINPKLTACKFMIKRNTRALHIFPTLQVFAEKSADTDLWWNKEERDNHFIFSPVFPLQGYRCCFCKKPMPKLGWGNLPLIGSSIITCDHCSSFYKLFYNKDTGEYGVIASEEKLHEYKRNFKLITEDDPEPNYQSEKYGFSLQNFDPEENLIIDVDTLSTANIFAFFCQINYLAVRKKDHYNILKEQLKEKHSHIDILLVDEPLTSVQPTKQQIGATRKLRLTSVASFDYAMNLLWSRAYLLDELRDFSDKRKISEAIEKITEQIQLVQRKQKKKEFLTSEEWNRLDARAANEVWGIIKPILEEYSFEIPNRFRSRHLEEVNLKPFGLYTSYSSGNTILNGAFKKISDKYNEMCNKLDFPWDGLEGICHEKTTGGVYGFSLDNQECFKTATISTTIESIVDGRITSEMLQSTRLRKHMPIYYLRPESQANMELINDCESILKKQIIVKINGSDQETTIEKAMKQLIKNLGKLLNDIVWNDEIIVTINGTKYYAWAAMAENKWLELTLKQQERIQKATQETYQQAKEYFQPFQYKPVSAEGDLDFSFS